MKTFDVDYPEDWEILEGLYEDVWDRGYFCEEDEGVWYEMYVTDAVKNILPKIDLSDQKMLDNFGCFFNLNLHHYEDDGQISFFVPNDEQSFDHEKMSINLKKIYFKHSLNIS